MARGAHSGALLSTVRRGTKARGAARVVEGVLLGSGVFLFLTAVAVGEGQTPGSQPVLYSALAAGVAAAVAWAQVHRRSFSQVAEDLGGRIGMAEVSAACSGEASQEPQPMVELAARRVLMRVPPSKLWLLALPVSWPLLLAPLLGGVALSIVTESQSRPGQSGIGRGTMDVLSQGATAAAGQVLTAVGEGRLDSSAAQAAMALADGARDLRARTPEAQSSQEPAWVADLEAWLDAAEALEQRVASDPLAQEALARARRAGEAALMAARGGSGWPVSDAGFQSPSPSPGVSLPGSSDPQSPATGQTTAPEEGTIPASPQTAEAGSDPGAPLPPVGVQRGAAPQRDARLAQRWLDHLKNQ